VIAIPAVVNYLGVRSGANLSSVMTVAKLSPLALLILFGVARFSLQPQMFHASEIASPGLSNWMSAMVLLVFAYGGWEDGLLPSGEVREPRRTIPFALGAGLAACALIYVMLQFITVAAIGTGITDRPLVETASVLLGHGGATFVTIAVLISTYGWISAAMLYGPRLAYSLAAQGDFPSVFAGLHPRFHTPAIAILFYAFTGWALAASGTFLWIVAVSSGSMIHPVCRNLCFPDPPAKVASNSRRLKNSIRTGAQYSWNRNLIGADDWPEASRTSLDVRHRTDCHRQLALGETGPLGTGHQGSGGTSRISSVSGHEFAAMAGQHDCWARDR
jgi:hypothetical protein